MQDVARREATCVYMIQHQHSCSMLFYVMA